MKQPLSMMGEFSQHVWKEYTKDTGNMLLVTGLLGWILSSAAQVTGIVLNKDIDKDKKMFLVPQEVLDGAVNAGLFWGITSSIKDFTYLLVERGKILLPNVKNLLVENKLDPKNLPVDKFDVSTIVRNTKNDELISTFAKSKNGIGICASFLGSVIACNIVTPFVRNYLGGMYQKHALASAAAEIPKTQIFATPMVPKSDDEKVFKPFVQQSVSTVSSSSLRI